ncbi:MAG: hypothetical protein AAFQ98_06920 [Bacteroidota bacterium]
MKESLNAEQWAHWEPIIRSKPFAELSSAEQEEARTVFGSSARYEQYRLSLEETHLLAQEPVPPLGSEVKRNLDAVWAEQPKATVWYLKPTLPTYQWAAACILFLLIGWGLRSLRPIPTQVVYETVVDTIYHTLPPDTITIVEVERIEIPVRVVEYRPLVDSSQRDYTQPGRQLSDDPELLQWMLSETE